MDTGNIGIWSHDLEVRSTACYKLYCGNVQREREERERERDYGSITYNVQVKK